MLPLAIYCFKAKRSDALHVGYLEVFYSLILPVKQRYADNANFSTSRREEHRMMRRKTEKMLIKWNILKSTIIIALRDKAGNVKKGHGQDACVEFGVLCTRSPSGRP